MLRAIHSIVVKNVFSKFNIPHNNCSAYINHVKVMGSIGVGFTSGYIMTNSFYKMKSAINEKCIEKTSARCDPVIWKDALFLVMTLVMDFNRNLWHYFKWMHTTHAIGISSMPSGYPSLMCQAKNRTKEEWDHAIMTMLGKQYYGKIMVHHVILATENEIYADLKDTSKVRHVSKCHSDWKWLKNKYGVVTLIWDSKHNLYHVHLYEAYLVVEVGRDAFGLFRVPKFIRFISHERFPIDADLNDVYVKEVVEKFEEDYEAWRVNA